MRSTALQRLELGLRMVADAIAQLQADDEWVDQASSPIGRRAHLDAVRAGKLAGHRVGAKVLVRRRHLDAFIEQHPARREVPTPAGEEAVAEDLAEILNFTAPRRRRAASR